MIDNKLSLQYDAKKYDLPMPSVYKLRELYGGGGGGVSFMKIVHGCACRTSKI